ncbi:DUF305 domain-containing protein [Actinoplanes philippinensis]|uniref:DUF305 domain-containing protein n=1 Tax=Actinoplanes philippinensis TaxID=35752 RepID=UPI0034105E92
MKSPTFLRRAFGPGALVLTLAVAACSGGGHSPVHSGAGAATSASASASPGAVFNDADAAFAEHMSVHHQQAIVMSALAAERAADPRVKELAAKIESAQSPEIATMTAWLSAWGLPPAETGDGHGAGHESMPGMMSAADMTKLAESTGQAFDDQFLTMMIAHHEGAVTMARAQIADGANPEAKALAAKIITGQQAEIAAMKAMSR